MRAKINISNVKTDNTFTGWPKSTLLESGNIPIKQIAELALREGQSSTPLYRVHRWFARRIGSQFRSILTALSLDQEQAGTFWDTYLGKTSIDGAIVLDPFIGGGTSLVESSRCNARVIGFDIDPVASFITRFELEASTMQANHHTIDEVCQEVADEIVPFHKTLVDGNERDVLHHFWVQVKPCRACGSDIELHPHYQLAHSKDKGLQWAFCKSCHAVHELPFDRQELRCSCGARTKIQNAPLNNGTIICPSCQQIDKLSAGDMDSAESPQWKLFAQEYLIGIGKKCTRHFKRAELSDLERYSQAELQLNSQEGDLLIPHRAIPREGRSDGRPLIHGIREYSDFFNARQKLHLHVLGKRIQQMTDASSRKCLEIAFSEHLTTNCMYTGYAFGYRRTSPMFSIHSYRHITRPVELNPWLDGVGRGTFVNTSNKIRKAIAFAKSPTELHPGGARQNYPDTFSRIPVELGTVSDVLSGKSTAAIENQSSEDLSILPDGTIDLILTDPPYFDNLSYSELSDFYLAWHQALGFATPPYDDPSLSAPIQQNLAISRRDLASIANYQQGLERIFSECYRVLKNNGICVFTYHHKLDAAWDALGTSLLKSGLEITKVLPMRGEGQGGLHTYEGTIKWDAVLVCRKSKIRLIDGVPIITHEKLEQALTEALTHNSFLSTESRIGFKEPDFINLARALIISKSFLGEISSASRPMLDVLKTIPALESRNGKAR